MASIPSKVAERLRVGIKRFQPILASAQSRDVNESDTVIIITDMLSEVFGYDKYAEVTSETAIRGTFCDLAVKLDGTLIFLVEAKAIGQDLKDAYLKQAIDYAANQGIDWVVLTNGVLWRIYKVTFAKPIDQELIAEINFPTLDPKDEAHLELLFLLTKEGWLKTAIADYFDKKQALSRFCIGAIILSEPLLKAVRKQLKLLSPDVRIDVEQIRYVLEHEVLKRDVVEGDKAEDACKQIARAVAKAGRASAKDEGSETAAQSDTQTEASSPAPAATVVPNPQA